MKKRFLLRVYNIPEDVSEEDIKQMLEHTVEILNIWIAKDKQNKCVGWSWIEFNNHDDLLMAKVYLNNLIWKKHTLIAMI